MHAQHAQPATSEAGKAPRFTTLRGIATWPRIGDVDNVACGSRLCAMHGERCSRRARLLWSGA
ncbi:hypothetical protein XvhCFBP2543_15720 [Xanthomonas vasicola]|nr:hypothetical protein NX05_03275 [Xanthomonas vasicola]KGR48073.1 hypothetical protein NX04_00060 [Xanthomonas vasicola]KGR62731.1 hypothetical protein NX79_00060 [Xanthomonas vasicola]PPV01666.1 hypothetical protein XvhCFBP2543_15720 [Xanthomonas vasicola]